jgi:hypothetical protein
MTIQGCVHERGSLLFVAGVGIGTPIEQRTDIVDIREKDSIRQFVVE